jgi:hypothetical protein
MSSIVITGSNLGWLAPYCIFEASLNTCYEDHLLDGSTTIIPLIAWLKSCEYLDDEIGL